MLKSLLSALLLTALASAAFAATAPATLAAPTGVTGSLAGSTFTLNWAEVAAAQGYNIRCAATDAALTALDTSDPAMTATLPTVNGTPLNPNTVTTYPVPNITAGQSCEVGAWACTATTCSTSVPSAHVIATAASSSSSSGGGSSSSSGSSSSGGSGSSSSGGGSGTIVTLTNGTAAMAWTAPTTNTDGSALTNLASYNVYQGTTPTGLAKVASVTTAAETLTLAAGTYFLAVTAVNATGNESAQSNLITVIVPQAVTITFTPSAPTGLKATISVTGVSQ